MQSMADTPTEKDIIRWFASLSEAVRYRFSTQWLNEQVGNLSNPVLAEYLPGDKRGSESFIKAFRSYDLKKQALKKISRPKDGYSEVDVHLICEAINQYRIKTNHPKRVCGSEFFQQAWQALSDDYPHTSAKDVTEAIVQAPSVAQSGKTMAKLPMSIVIACTLLLLSVLVTGLFYVPDNTVKVTQRLMPGAVVQLKMLNDRAQTIVLSPPEFYLSADTCFDELTAKKVNMTAFSLAQMVSSNPQDSLTLLLPEILTQPQLWRSEGIHFTESVRYYLTKGTLNLGVSARCLASLQHMMDAGSAIEHFAMVKQVFVANNIEIDLGVIAKGDEVRETLVAQLTQYFSAYDIDKDKQRFIIKGPVVLGYISQPMSAIMSE